MSVAALLVAACADPDSPGRQVPGADSDRGQRIADRVACGACHDIPGVAWPRGRVGGALKGFASRPLIAGRLPNQPDVLIRFLRDPPALAPDTAMPPQPLSVTEARDVAAFLYTLQ